MKLIKILLKLVLCAVALLLAAVLALPLWFGPVAKSVANSAVPKILKTGFHLGQLSFNPYTGRLEVGDLRLSNPEGYSAAHAATLGSLVFDAEPLSLASDVIHIEEITIRDVYVSYLNGGPKRVNNFTQIQYNLDGGREAHEAKQREKETDKEKGKNPDAPAESKPEKKVIIDRLSLSGVSFQVGILPIPVRVPVSITLKDIGRESNGATWEEVFQKVWAAVLKASGAVGDQLKDLNGLLGDTTKRTTAVVTEATSKAAEGTKKVVDGASKVVGNAAQGTAKAVGGAADGATKAAGEAAKKVGDGATKALESLKSLW